MGRFIHKGHKIGPWQYSEENAKLYHLKGSVMDVYTPSLAPRFTRCPNCWTRSCICQPNTAQGQIFSVKESSPNSAVYTILCYTNGPLEAPPPTNFGEVLLKWESSWMWENLTWTGDHLLIAEVIADDSCIAVTNRLYMADLYPQIHSAALVLECTKGRGRLWCSFPEQAINAGSYRGKLAGLMAIHLLLLATNEVHPGLQGSITFFSDCISRLDKAQHLPPLLEAFKASYSIISNV
jgi:hypothetical protein